MEVFILFFTIIIVCSPVTVFSHHAMEYIELESFTIAPKGGSVFHLHYDYMVDDNNDASLDHWEITPGISYGAASFLMFDIHTHFAKFGPGHIVPEKLQQYPLGTTAMMEAVALSLQAEIINSVIQIGAGLTYEYPYQQAQDILDGKQVGEAVLIIAKEFEEHKNVTLNIKYGKEESVDGAFEWGLGTKTPLTDDEHGIGAGIEISGNVPQANESFGINVMQGFYIPFAENIRLKTGIAVGYDFKAEKSSELHYSASFFYSF